MGRLGTRERAVFTKLRALSRTGLDSAGLRGAVAREITRYLRADAYCAMELDPTTTLPVHDVNWGWPPGYELPLGEHALFAGPTADTAHLASLPMRAVTVEELLGGADPRRDPYYLHHLWPFHHAHEVQWMCTAAGAPRALFTFSRGAGAGRFEPRQLRLLHALSPHVGAGVHAATVRASLDERPGAGAGLLVLDRDGRLEASSGAGELLIGRTRPPLGLSMFLGLQRRAIKSGEPPRLHRMMIGQGYRASAERRLDPHGAPRVEVLLERARPADDCEGLLRLGLTPREAEVTLELLGGASHAIVATRLGCATETAARHAKNIYAKLGVRSRRELGVRLLAAGSRGITPANPSQTP